MRMTRPGSSELVCGNEGSAPMPSAHDRRAVPFHPLVSPRTFEEKSKQGAWRREWGGASEMTGFKIASAFWRQMIAIHT